MYKALHEHQLALNLVGVDVDDEGEPSVSDEVIAAEKNAAIQDESEEEDPEEAPRAGKRKPKPKPASNVGWLQGDMCVVRWCHPDSLNSQFRGCYYVATVIDVFTNSTGRKTYTVQYGEDGVVEENVKHGNTKQM